MRSAAASGRTAATSFLPGWGIDMALDQYDKAFLLEHFRVQHNTAKQAGDTRKADYWATLQAELVQLLHPERFN